MSIDNAVREVVKQEVDEAMTTLIDEKVQKTVVELTVDGLEEYLDEKVEAAVEEIDIDSKIESAIEDITPDSIGAAYDDHSHDYAEEDHDHDSYDIWFNIKSYVEDAIESKITQHTEEKKHGGQSGDKIDGSALNVHLANIQKVIGMKSYVDESLSINGKSFSPGDKVEGLAVRVDQLMAWAAHVDKVLKAAAQSELFPTKETV